MPNKSFQRTRERSCAAEHKLSSRLMTTHVHRAYSRRLTPVIVALVSMGLTGCDKGELSTGNRSPANQDRGDRGAGLEPRAPSTPDSAVESESPPSGDKTSSADTEGRSSSQYVFLRAAEGDRLAQFLLGLMYEDGDGVPQDYDEAVRWYMAAAASGYAAAEARLGYLYDFGRGRAEDKAQAVSWYKRAAQNGSAAGQLALGMLYASGEGVKQDYAETARLYRLAAGSGLALAQEGLGELYASGNGVPTDLGEAARLHRLAAEQGLPIAQYNLATALFNGNGVPTDHEAAALWYRKAAEQGYEQAMVQLARMYINGQGLTPSPIDAYMWLELADRSGDKEAAIGRKLLAEVMEEADIREAQQRARDRPPLVLKNQYDSIDAFTRAARMGAIDR